MGCSEFSYQYVNQPWNYQHTKPRTELGPRLGSNLGSNRSLDLKNIPPCQAIVTFANKSRNKRGSKPEYSLITHISLEIQSQVAIARN